MNTLLAVLFTATLGSSQITYLENVKSGDFTYVSYTENSTLMLVKLAKDFSHRKNDVVDTGISTNGIEKVTMSAEQGIVEVVIRYQNGNIISAHYSADEMQLEQISSVEEGILAEYMPEQK